MKSRGVKDYGVGAVPPRSLESNDQSATIGRELEALLREWWPRNVPAQSLEPSSITTIDRRACMHIHPAHVGERLVGRRKLADWMHELARSLAGLGAQELAVADRRAIAGRERGLVLAELVGRIIEFAQVTTVALAYADESRVGRACDGGDIFGGRARERTKAQLAVGLADVDAVEHEAAAGRS